MAAMTTQELHDFVLSNSENISSSIVTSYVDRDFPCFEVKKENILELQYYFGCLQSSLHPFLVLGCVALAFELPPITSDISIDS